MTNPVATPNDSRYIPFTQQPACCVPTCIQMVMHKEEVPLMPAEEIGYHLGLTVSPDRSYLFYNVRTVVEAPPAGYGTQIYLPEFEPNAVFKKLNIPLTLLIEPITDFMSSIDLLSRLRQVEEQDENALLCFNHGVLIDDNTMDWGHVCVFDRVVDGKIRIIDPSPNHPKWRLVETEKLFNAMQKHGVKKSAGIWQLNKK